jgi:hypothetical protein
LSRGLIECNVAGLEIGIFILEYIFSFAQCWIPLISLILQIVSIFFFFGNDEVCAI